MDQAMQERQQRTHDDLYRRATNMNRTAEENELLQLAKASPPETAQYIKDTIMFRRMETLRAQDDAKRQREFERKVDPEFAQKMEALLEQQHHRQELSAEEIAQRDYWEAQPVPGPEREPLHPDELKQAQDKMLQDVERQVERLPEQSLGNPIDHAHATRKMVRDMEREPESDPLARLREHVREQEQKRERER